nr:glycosyltransferase family 39 protein [Desulfobacterales bacterium]
MARATKTKDRSKYILGAGFLLLFMSFACLTSLSQKSPTVDEFAQLPAGYYYWRTGDFSLYSKSPPLIKLLCALPLLTMDIRMDAGVSYPEAGAWRPWIFGTRFMRDNADRYDTIFFWGRIPVLVLSICLGGLVFLWGSELYGTMCGLVSLFLYTFSPNILAHARLATTDIGATYFFFLSMYSLWRFLKFRRMRTLVVTGVCTGLALLCKYTALLLFPIFFSILAVSSWSENWKNGSGFNLLRNCLRNCINFLVIVVVAIFVINLGYGFCETGKPLREIPHYSRLYRMLDRYPLRDIPIPLPAMYVQGFDLQKADAEQGEFLNYLNGRFSSSGWWYYFIYAFFIKTPIPLQIGLLFSILCMLKKGAQPRDELFLLTPILAIFLVFSFLNHLDVGLRYVLPAFPFLFVWIGGLARVSVRHQFVQWGLIVLIAAYAWSAISIFPHYLAYFNIWAGGPASGRFHLIDSNLDWGQDLKGLKCYMEENKIKDIGLAYFGHVDPKIYNISYHLIGKRPETGIIAISSNYLQGMPYLITYTPKIVPVMPNTFKWLQGYKPIHSIGYSILIYRVSEIE